MGTKITFTVRPLSIWEICQFQRFLPTYLLLVLFVGLIGSAWAQGSNYQRTIQGTVIDGETQQALAFAHISIGGNEVGTLTNTNGQFVLKIPKHLQQDTLHISYLGYSSKTIPMASLTGNSIEISMGTQNLTLDAIDIPSIDPRDTIRKAWRVRRVNYEIKPTLLRGFYREEMQDEGLDIQFLFAEGVLELYKAPYHMNQGVLAKDRVRVLKGRQKSLPKAYIADGQEHLLPHITQGPHLGLILDIVKDDGSFVKRSNQGAYLYEYLEVQYLDNRLTYLFSFFPKNPSNSYAHFQGKVYLDVETLAFVRAEYEVTEAGIQLYNRTSDNLELDKRSFEVNYMLYQDKWYLRDARVANEYYYPAVDRSLSSTHTFLTTDIINEQVSRFSSDDALGLNEAFVEEVEILDEKFWEEYNVVPPDKQ